MSWSEAQRKRLAKERRILREYFPTMTWIDPIENTYLEGWIPCNSGEEYLIRLYLPQDYPSSVPTAVVAAPTLYDYYGNQFGMDGIDSSMHVLDSTDGGVTICHYRPDLWHPRVTLYKVLVKVRIWLEAFEAHQATGNDLDYYLRHQ